MRCFYHIDMDGKCAAAIVKRKFPDKWIKFTAINYNHRFPWDEIKPGEEVIFVDFSLLEGEFDRLLKITENVTWIDHHKTAIDFHRHLSDKIAGLRYDDKPSGCMAAWHYYFPNEPAPRVLELLDDYDIWEFKYGDDTRMFQLGCRCYNTQPWADTWKGWLDYNESHKLSEEVIRKGAAIKTYNDKEDYGRMKSWAFYVNHWGYRVISACGKLGSQVFDSVPKDSYDIMAPFFFDGERWTFSLYTENPDIDVSKIAVEMGGGGHVNAAGFVTPDYPFKGLEIKRYRDT